MTIAICLARKPKESHARYQQRRAHSNTQIDAYLKHGRSFWDSNKHGTYHVGDVQRLAKGKHVANRPSHAGKPIGSTNHEMPSIAAPVISRTGFLRALLRRAISR